MHKRVPSLFKNDNSRPGAGNEYEIQMLMFPKYASSLVSLIQDIEATTVNLKTEIDHFHEITGLESKFKVPELIAIDGFETLCSRASFKQEAVELDKLRAS